MEEIEQLINVQRDRLNRIKQTLVNYKKDSQTRKTKTYFEERISRAREIAAQFNSAHDRLISLGIASTHTYITNECVTRFEESYIDLQSVLTEGYESLYPSTTSANLTSGTANTIMENSALATVAPPSIQFARIPAPTFSGKVVDWPSFYDAFDQLINKNSGLTNVQRFHYLKQALPRNRDVDIHHMLMADENYPIAWDLLKKRYNNSRILFAHHMNSLYTLPTLLKETSEDIKAMLSAATVCINEFKRLRIPIEVCDHWIAHYLSTKLPTETHKAWERHLGTNVTIPTFSELETFLTARLFTIDAIEHRHLSHNLKPDNKESRYQKSQLVGKSPNQFHKHSLHLQTTNHNQHPICSICTQTHITRRCPIFLEKDCFERKNLAVKHKLCINCLSNAHTTSRCTSTRNCRQCGQRHHSLLHFPTSNTPAISNTSPADNNYNSLPTSNSSHVKINDQKVHTAHTRLCSFNQTPFSKTSYSPRRPVLLATAMVTLSHPDTNERGVFCALIDQGSEGTIVSERVVQTLNLQRHKSKADICGLGTSTINQSRYVVSCSLLSHVQEQFITLIEVAHVLPQLNIRLPNRLIANHNWTHTQGIQLADPNYFRCKKIDLILGADVYPDIILPEMRLGNKDEPMAQNTKLGWILSGKLPVDSITTQIRCNVNLLELEQLVHKLYESEDIPTKRVLSEQDQWCEEHFRKTHKRLPNGKYMVRLPLKSIFDSRQGIGKSKQTALNRFFYLERRFHRDADFAQKYTAVMNEYFDLHQITPVTPSSIDDHHWDGNGSSNMKSCVLPHHAILKESRLTTKVRIVFDASAKTSNGRSLNNLLCIGPTLQTDLAAVILNWRSYKFVFLSDIQKMYRCIEMHPEDAHYQRILWRNHDNKITEYCLTTVTFGTASAPFTAIRVLHQLAEDEKHRYPLAYNVLKGETYVDDILSGGDNIVQATQKRDQVIMALRSAGMELRKWSSNTQALLKNIPVEHQSCHSNSSLNTKDLIKTLGIIWSHEQDHLTFKVQFDLPSIFSKRSILSTIARLFDPLGLISPVVITAKLILKEIWTTKVSRMGMEHSLQWDDELPETIVTKWKKFTQGIHALNTITIPRWINTVNNSSIELHAFCDGSSTSYAAAVYCRLRQQQRFLSHLIVAKTRVTPNKPLTIPRIELCGATLAITLVDWVKEKFKSITQDTPVFFWTDATIVLYWINGETDRWQTYVSNRVHKILEHSSPAQWAHVATTDNPADCATRGLTPAQLANFHLWWHGPPWLIKSKDQWPQFHLSKITPPVGETEEKPNKINTLICTFWDEILHKYSDLHKMVNILSWIHRFRQNCQRKPSERLFLPLTVSERNTSLTKILGLVQRDVFGTEITLISRQLTIPNTSKLCGLTPFLDQDQLLRVRGRLEHSQLSYSQKHPIIMPTSHYLTLLLIDNAHKTTLHGGIQLTLTKIRQRYWILNARKAVKNRIKQCVRCTRQRPTTVTQLMGDLPSARVTATSRPFVTTGVDYTGSIALKASRYRGQTTYKGYIAIFICLVSKAIHLEAVTGMTTQHFLWAFHRFIGRRGLCREVYSDCGTNFQGAASILHGPTASSRRDIASELAKQEIQWHFNPPYSPNFGGLWEANVKSTKHHLRRIIGESNLTYEELSTMLVQIEACLNSRPLCPLTTDPNDLAVLTPAHFLIADSLLAMPDISPPSKGLTMQYFELQRKIRHFWKRWSADWLSHLQTRPKWKTSEPNLQINELVLVKEDNLPPHQWKLGRIVEVHPGADHLVRVVTVRTKSGTYTRSISKICRLPIPLPEAHT